MEFVKMHGTGNDFIIIEDFENKYINEEANLAIKLCHRRFGIGADGLVFVRKSKFADVEMVIINSDGSRANMCGNAIRCFSKYVYDERIVYKDKISIETGDGIKEVYLTLGNGGLVSEVRVYMGQASFDGDKIELVGKDRLINESIFVNDKEIKATSLLVGVPHTIIFKNDGPYDISEAKYIEKHNLFKNGTNVNYVTIIDEENIKVETWERGAGATLSCGTGCSASVVVANMQKLSAKKVNVWVPGGKLFIELEDDKIFMTGEAVNICRGIAF